MQYLKADTNVEVLLGPAVAVGDGFTPVTTLTLSGADEAEIIKYNGATALVVTSISGNTIAAITGADGYYTVDITTGNVDTEGPLTILVNDDSLILPIRQDYMVVNANVYDSLMAVAGTDVLDVSLTEMGGVAQSATDLKDFADAGYDPATNKVTGVLLVDTTTVSTDAEADIAALNDFNPASDDVAVVTLVTTTTTNTDMRGTDSALLASSDGSGLTEAGGTGDHLTAINLPNQTMDITGTWTGSLTGSVGSVTGAVGSVTGAVGSVAGNVDGSVASVTAIDTTAGAIDNVTLVATTTTNTDAITVSGILTTQMTESYAADGVAPTLAQAQFFKMQLRSDFSISGTTYTVRQIDGSTTAYTLTLDDDTNPTSATRTT